MNCDLRLKLILNRLLSIAFKFDTIKIESEKELNIKKIGGVIKMEVNKIIYIVLAVFLGSFGVHKFYAGKTMSGILHLAFFWTGIPHIIAIISAILTLFRPADENGNVVM